MGDSENPGNPPKEEEEEEEEEELDPRIQEELEHLNEANAEINRGELELDAARCRYRRVLSDSARRLNSQGSQFGACIERARPYYEARRRAKEAQQETQRAALRYERAVGMHNAAREMVFVAEQGMGTGKNRLDPTWQEMLNHATRKVNEAEQERLCSEREHQRVTRLCHEAEAEVQRLQKSLRRDIARSRPYFELKAQFNLRLEEHKSRVTSLEAAVAQAKLRYSVALRNLEQISEEIHARRFQRILRKKNLRENPLGAEGGAGNPEIPGIPGEIHGIPGENPKIPGEMAQKIHRIPRETPESSGIPGGIPRIPGGNCEVARETPGIPGIPGEIRGIPRENHRIPGGIAGGIAGGIPGIPRENHRIPGGISGIPGENPGIPRIPGEIPGIPREIPRSPGEIPGIPRENLGIPNETSAGMGGIPREIPGIPRENLGIPRENPGNFSSISLGTSGIPRENPENPENSMENPGNFSSIPSGTFGIPGIPRENPENSMENPRNFSSIPSGTFGIPGISSGIPRENPENPGNFSSIPSGPFRIPGIPRENPENSMENPENPTENPRNFSSTTAGLFQIPGIPQENPENSTENPENFTSAPLGPFQIPGIPRENPENSMENPENPMENPGNFTSIPSGPFRIPGIPQEIPGIPRELSASGDSLSLLSLRTIASDLQKFDSVEHLSGIPGISGTPDALSLHSEELGAEPGGGSRHQRSLSL